MTFINTKDIDTKEVLPGWEGRYFSSEHMTFGYYDFSEGSNIHEHFHDNEETWHVITGELEVTINGVEERCGPGTVAVVAPNAPHSVIALSDGKAIVVDSPRRQSVGGVSIS